jgi:hypothetical protein
MNDPSEEKNLAQMARGARSLALASFIAAVVASVIVLIWPVSYSGIKTSSTGIQVYDPGQLVWFGMLRSEGPRFLIYLLVPIGLTALGVQAFRIKNRLLSVTTAWIVAIFWLLLDLAAMFTIGIFYLPSAILMIFAALKASVQKIEPSLLDNSGQSMSKKETLHDGNP